MINLRFTNKDFLISFFEQFSLNVGSFIFFILSANLIGAEQFGMFAVLLVGAQIIQSLAVQWILLPITSKNLSFGNKQVLEHVIKKILILAVVAPIFTWLYSIFLSPDLVNFIQFVMVYILGILMVLADTTRYYLIRLRKVKILLIANFTRWTIALLLLYFYVVNIEDQYSAVLYTFVFSIFVIVLIQVIYIIMQKATLSDSQNYHSLQTDNPLFNLGLANIFNTIAITLLFNKVNIVAFGALQAFRSLINLFPFIMQFIESHYSAMMVVNNKTKLIKREWLYMYVSITCLILIILSLYGDFILNIIYTNEYAKFHFLFVILFLIVAIQSFSRLFSVQLRLKEIYKPFNNSAVILWISTGVLIFFSYGFLSKINYQLLLSIMLVTSILQMMIYIISIYKIPQGKKI